MANIYAQACLQNLDKQFLPIAKDFLARWLENRSMGLLLTGPNGVGKSYAAAAIMNEVMQSSINGRRIDGAFMTSPLIYERYASITRKDFVDDYRGQLFAETLDTVDVLVWNDLGKENRTGGYYDQVVACFGRLLRHRVEHGLSTIFTTNLPMDEESPETVQSVFGKDFWSLLFEAAPLRYDTIGQDRRMG